MGGTVLDVGHCRTTSRHGTRRLFTPYLGGQMKRHVHLAAILVIACVVASLGVACGDAEETSGGEPIKVGAPIPLTGPWAADGQTMKQGLEIAVEEINTDGGVLGRPVELVTYDVEDMAPEKLNAAASKLLVQEKCSAIITGYSTPGADVTAFGKYPQPFLQFDASSQNVKMVKSDPAQYGHVFTLGDVEEPYGRQTFELVSGLPVEWPNRKVVILAGDFEWDKKITEAIKAQAEESGWEVAMYEVFPYGTREWGPILTRIRDISPAIIHWADMDPADAKTFLTQFRQNPTDSVVEIGYVVSIKGFTDIVGEAGEGVLGISTNSILPDEQGDAFRQRFEDKYGEQPGLSIVGTVYDGVHLWARAVEQAGDPDDYDAVADAIYGLRYRGVNGTYAFTEGNIVPAADPDEGLPMFFFQIQDGELTTLNVGSQPVGTFALPPWLK